MIYLLCVFSYRQGLIIENLVPKKSHRVSQLADMSVVAFVKIVAMIKRSHKLDKYKRNKELNERMPNYSVKMGFGLHVGWAIEGAIGSDFKIDASYLSPNVNMASRLEAATKQFGVPILISGPLYRILTSKTQTYMRHIDTVKVKGSKEPMELYTCDVDPNELTVEKPAKHALTRQEKKMNKVRARIKRNRYKQAALSNQIPVSAKFEEDPDISAMRAPFKKVNNKSYNPCSLSLTSSKKGSSTTFRETGYKLNWCSTTSG